MIILYFFVKVKNWTKLGALTGIVGIITTLTIAILISYDWDQTIIPDAVSNDIHSDIENLLFEQLSSDIDILLAFAEDDNIKSPFTLEDMKNNDIIFCENEKINLKCDSLRDLRTTILTFSPYILIFIYPQENIDTESGTISVRDCIIELISIDGHDVVEIENKWNDRQWCTHDDAISMTDQYIPRGKTGINVNSLSMRYNDSDHVRSGLVIAYHFEKLMEKYAMDSPVTTFNMVLLDKSNCVSGAVSKTNGKTTIHLDENLYRLTQKVENQMEIKEWTSTDEIDKTNCHFSETKYQLDSRSYIHLEVKENLTDNFTSKLDGDYFVYEIATIDTEEVKNESGDVNIFQDWKLLISVK